MKRENNDFSHLAAAHVVSSDDLAAAGKALRQEVLRKEHGWWKPAEDRANLIDTLRKLDEGRMKEQLPTPLRTDASISFRLLSWCSRSDGGGLGADTNDWSAGTWRLSSDEFGGCDRQPPERHDSVR